MLHLCKKFFSEIVTMFTFRKIFNELVTSQASWDKPKKEKLKGKSSQNLFSIHIQLAYFIADI